MTSMTIDICEIIRSYIQKPRYELLEWIDKDKLDWDKLSSNPKAIDHLKENQDKINWYWMSYNPSIFKEVYNDENKKLIQKVLEIILIN